MSKEEPYPTALNMKHFWASKYQKTQTLNLEIEKELQQISLQRNFPQVSEIQEQIR